MISEGTLTGSVTNSGALQGNVQSNKTLRGTMVVSGGGGSKDAVLYVEQELDDEQKAQARSNIGTAGKIVAGQTLYSYTPKETSDDLVFIKESPIPIEAAEGTEIFNNYADNVATGYYSIASGFGTQALGDFSNASGWLTRAGGYCSISSGRRTEADGSYAHSEGIDTSAPKNAAHSEGEGTNANGARAHAEGYYTTCGHNQAHAEGMNTVASAVNSHAEGWGTTASGQNSFTGGRGTSATATNSTAKGEYTIASARNQTALGKYNIKDSTNLIIVGNGTADTARSNAFTLSSTGSGWFAGAVTSTGADYAEFFEWADGNLNEEDRIGMIVTLEGDKIKLANDGDDFIGIVSGTAGVLGDNAEHEWTDKYVTDEYGRIVYEDVEEFEECIENESNEVIIQSAGLFSHPKLNPAYDSTKHYISRADRKEWDVVGLLGKLHVNDDGTCVVGGYATVGVNGVATASTDKTTMRVMKRITENVVLVLLK